MDCIVNVTQNWGIGKDGDLLVSIPTDLRRFRALTTGKTVIYGRKTLLTFPHARPLPNRENWILSATPGLFRAGAAVFSVACGPAGSLRTRPGRSLCLSAVERLPRAAAVVQPRAAHADLRRPACRPVFPRSGPAPELALHGHRPPAGRRRPLLPLSDLRKRRSASIMNIELLPSAQTKRRRECFYARFYL